MTAEQHYYYSSKMLAHMETAEHCMLAAIKTEDDYVMAQNLPLPTLPQLLLPLLLLGTVPLLATSYHSARTVSMNHFYTPGVCDK